MTRGRFSGGGFSGGCGGRNVDVGTFRRTEADRRPATSNGYGTRPAGRPLADQLPGAEIVITSDRLAPRRYRPKGQADA